MTLFGQVEQSVSMSVALALSPVTESGLGNGLPCLVHKLLPSTLDKSGTKATHNGIASAPALVAN